MYIASSTWYSSCLYKIWSVSKSQRRLISWIKRRLAMTRVATCGLKPVIKYITIKCTEPCAHRICTYKLLATKTLLHKEVYMVSARVYVMEILVAFKTSTEPYAHRITNMITCKMLASKNKFTKQFLTSQM